MWFCVALAADLARPGAFRTVTVGRESVLLVRGRDGEVRAFLNVCRHRGARLCARSRGTAAAQPPVPVPRLDVRPGRQAGRRAQPDVDAGRRPRRVRPRRRRAAGVARVRVGLPGAGPAARSRRTCSARSSNGSATPAAIERYGIERLALGRRITYDVTANWKLVIENFMECYHCATIHPELTEVLPEFADGYAAQYYVGHGAEFGADVAGFTVDGRPGRSGCRASPTTRTAATTRSRSSRRSSSTWCPTTSSCTGCSRWRRIAPIVECDWLYAPDVVASGRDLARRWNSSTGSTSRTSRPANAPSPG